MTDRFRIHKTDDGPWELNFGAHNPRARGYSLIRVGSFRTPEEARRRVLVTQAEYLELKASKYRAEAAKIAECEQNA